MRLVDDEGRLFGRVNVIDAFVVVSAIALVAGGIFVVVGDEPGNSAPNPTDGPEPPRYASVSYEVPLDSSATTLAAGETLEVDGTRFTITDVHLSTTTNATAHVTARIEYRGNLSVDDDRVLAGDEVRLVTDTTRTRANVIGVALDDGLIDESERSLVIRSDAEQPGVTAVEAGDVVRVGGEEVATVQAVVDGAGGSTDVGLTITARETTAGPSFGGKLIRVGERVGVVTDDAIVRGRIVALGTSDPEEVG